jgi:hypothetical protein
MRDLNKRSKDKEIQAVLSAFAKGNYQSFEAALVDLVCRLADDKARLQKRVNELVRGREKGPDTR